MGSLYYPPGEERPARRAGRSPVRDTVSGMPCLVGCLALFTPRFAIVLIVIFSDYIGRAYETVLWPFLGFLLMPLTTLAYAWAMHTRGSVAGIQLVVVVLAVLIDLGLIGGGGAVARKGD